MPASRDPASQLAIEILNGARRWTQARLRLRLVLDSKSATPKQIEKAKVDFSTAGDELEALVVRLERFMKNSGKQVSSKRGAANTAFPWRELFGMVSAGAKAVESALGQPVEPVAIRAKVIDVEPDK